MLLVIAFLFFCSLLETDTVVRGKTYEMNIPEGWELGTSEKMMGKPAHRMLAGHEVYITCRINPDRESECSIEISEYLRCSDWSLIQKYDSVALEKSPIINNTKWISKNKGSIKCIVDIVGKPHRHIETGEELILCERKWYMAGKNNVYTVTFSTTSSASWIEWLPKIELYVNSLKEIVVPMN